MIQTKTNKRKDRQHQPPTDGNTINFTQATQARKRKPVELVPKTENQAQYIAALTDPDTDIVIATGPAGTGKTYLAMQAALRAYRDGLCERIVLTRPSISIENESHGFLPGDLNSKLEPWVRPMVDVFREYYSLKEIKYMLETETLELAPLGMMRGRTFKNTWLMLDEAQNATPAQLKMLLTRIGYDSKIIISGDVEQTDRRTPDNGLLDLCDRLDRSSVAGIQVCEFTSRDIQRHRLVGEVLKLYS
jgi:phosphate starvation-inducible PhoH-like protein